MSEPDDDPRWMQAALGLAERGRGRTVPNPNVGCVIVREGRVAGRGWTQPGGRPHAEGMALGQAGEFARGSTVHVTLEPCAHESPRGPACADLLAAARPRRVVAALEDPDPRTAGKGFGRLREAGIEVVVGACAREAAAAMSGFLTRQARGRPHVTLKLATSLDGRIALPDGSSRWITGKAARAHAHLERSRHDAILVGRGTFAADAPRLDVRLPGLEARSPRRLVLSSRGQLPPGAEGWTLIPEPGAIRNLPGIDTLLVEGGAGAASAFLAADLVDRLIIYRAPILLGAGPSAIEGIAPAALADAHGRWRLFDERQLGPDRLEIHERQR